MDFDVVMSQGGGPLCFHSTIRHCCHFNHFSQSADIGHCRSSSDLCISGMILHGDAARFVAIAKHYPAGTLVWLDGPRGYIAEALDMGDIIHDQGFSTAVSIPTGACGSSCAVLFLSGNHAIIQRNSELLFHQPFSAIDGHSIDADTVDYFATRIAKWGVTRRQAWALLNAAPSYTARPGTEAWARQLGFNFVVVPNFFGLWRSCQAKFCVAAP
jgi:hypothetical protein